MASSMAGKPSWAAGIIPAAKAFEQAIGFFNCSLRLVGQARTYFQTDIAIDAVGLVINRLKDIRRTRDVVDDQRLVDVLDTQTGTNQRTQLIVVVCLAGSRLVIDQSTQ